MKQSADMTKDIPTQIKNPELVKRRRRQIVDAAVQLFIERQPVFPLAPYMNMLHPKKMYFTWFVMLFTLKLSTEFQKHLNVLRGDGKPWQK